VKTLMFCICWFLTSCAGYSITANGKGSGYDVFRPAPYLLGNPLKDKDDKPNGYEYKVIWLPDYSQPYRIDTWNFLGQGHFKFTIEDGWRLTGIDADSDNTGIAAKLLDVVKGSLKPETIALSSGGAKPQLFKIEFDSSGHLSGLLEVGLVVAK
jgi:hypothetical protein